MYVQLPLHIWDSFIAAKMTSKIHFKKSYEGPTVGSLSFFISSTTAIMYMYSMSLLVVATRITGLLLKTLLVVHCNCYWVHVLSEV